MSADRQLVTVREAMKITGLTHGTLYRLARERRLRSFKVLGTALRFDRADLEALVEERAVAQ